MFLKAQNHVRSATSHWGWWQRLWTGKMRWWPTFILRRGTKRVCSNLTLHKCHGVGKEKTQRNCERKEEWYLKKKKRKKLCIWWHFKQASNSTVTIKINLHFTAALFTFTNYLSKPTNTNGIQFSYIDRLTFHNKPTELDWVSHALTSSVLTLQVKQSWGQQYELSLLTKKSGDNWSFPSWATVIWF